MESLIDQVDALFAQWDSPGSPGCALGVISAGELIYRRGYGSANLDYDLPITAGSVFQIASMSKQFTAACIVLLAQRGKLCLDDDIRQYVPEVPDYGPTITIRHLIHHTSGLRSNTSLMDLAGLALHNNAETVRLLARQESLDFRPGDEHVYCNSGYILLAEVVERVTGGTLREFAQENIFVPLGMKDTRFNDDHSDIVRNRAVSYRPGPDSEFRRFTENSDIVGSTGVVSTIDDLLRWDRNFYHPQVGGQAFIARMLAPGVLNNGREIHYAFGLAHGEYRGLRMVWHGGLVLGFRSQMIRFPEQAFTVICLANLQGFSVTRLIHRVADIYLAGAFTEPEVSVRHTIRLPEQTRADLAGVYFHPGTGFSVEVLEQAGMLMVEVFGAVIPVAPVSASEANGSQTIVLQELGGPLAMNFSFERPAPDQPWLLYMTVSMHRPPLLRPIEVVSPSAGRLSEYTGIFTSDELDVAYEVEVMDGRLNVQYGNEAPFPLKPALEDLFRAGSGSFTFERGGEGEVTGFVVNEPMARNIRFRRRA